MKVNYTACAICDSSWGDLWEVVEGERLFFCCEVCAVQFRGLVARIKAETGWATIERLTVAGDRRGRTAEAQNGTAIYRCEFAYNAQGALRSFRRSPEQTPGVGTPRGA